MTNAGSSVRCWLQELRYETESYDPHNDGLAPAAARRQARASWSPLLIPPYGTGTQERMMPASSSSASTSTSSERSLPAHQVQEKISIFVSDGSKNPISEDGAMRPRLATTSITPGHVTSAARQLATSTQQQQRMLPDVAILRHPCRLQPRPYSHQHPKQPSHLYRPPAAAAGLQVLKVIRECPIDRVKVSVVGAAGAKLPRHWSTGMQGLLTEAGLFFAEDRNSLLAMKSGVAGVCRDKVDLRGAKVHRDLEHVHSAKRNVLVVTGQDGTVALVQNEDGRLADNWYCDIHRVIEMHQHQHHLEQHAAETSPGPVSRSALTRFFKKRPPKETLVNQGIYKNEPIFGNTLERLFDAADRRQPVPKFVARCTDILENPPHVFSVGLYRTSGNLSHIQKLRLRVDQEDEAALDDLNVASDSDVLAGALKLFFRELQAPLLPYPVYLALSEACGLPDVDRRLTSAREAVRKLSEPHKVTLACLCAHLLRITVHEKQNQMSAANLGIVWGPSFTWPDENAGPKALHQCTDVNRVVQYLIEASHQLFPLLL